MALITLCPHCRADLNIAPGERLPPWCGKCGESLDSESVEKVEATQKEPATAGPATSPGTLCPSCNSNLNVAPGEPMPPWCRVCGVSLSEPTDRPATAAVNEQPVRTDVPRSDNQPLESIGYEPSPSVIPEVQQIQTERLHREFREKFARHNVIVGIVLGFWSVWAISANDMRTADVHRLEAEQQLSSTITALQVVTFLTGSLLIVSGYGIARRESWGYLFAGVCAAAAIIAGLVFLGGLVHLRSKANDLAGSVAMITYIRWNIDLLIGLVDGGALLVFLYRYSQLPPDPTVEQPTFEDERDVWPEWS